MLSVRACLLVLAAWAMLPAAASAQTTTTTSSTTTTSTPGGCGPDDVTLEGFRCRVEAFLADVRAAGDLDRLQQGMVKKMEKAVGNIDDAVRFCAGGDEKKAGKQVQQCARHVATTVSKLRSNNGRKLVPFETRRALGHTGDELADDLKGVRHGVSCP